MVLETISLLDFYNILNLFMETKKAVIKLLFQQLNL